MLALLHTSPLHIPVFDALRDEEATGLPLRHIVREDLLDQARTHGPAAVADAVGETLAEAAAGGARAVLCTCSTIGGIAETGSAAAAVPVLRVDRPMAAAAVAVTPAPSCSATRIAVIAALSSTIEPTAALIRDEAERAGRTVTLDTRTVPGAWAAFESGDREGYLTAVAEAVDAVTDADVIVLAQASMAPAQARATTVLPVLSSPRPGLRAAAAAAGAVPER